MRVTDQLFLDTIFAVIAAMMMEFYLCKSALLKTVALLLNIPEAGLSFYEQFCI